MKNFIPFQAKIRQFIPKICAGKEFQDFVDLLERMHDILIQSGIEQEVVSHYLEIAQRDDYFNYQQLVKEQDKIRIALRCAIARAFSRLSFRQFSLRLAESRHLQRFCLIDDLVIIKVLTKSQCQRYEAMFTVEMIGLVIIQLNLAAAGSDNPLELKKPMDHATPVSLDDLYIDTTCVDANIHFPVDWVLLRDAVRTLMKATILIREKGLKHRMQPPEEFMRRMNQLCIEMTHTRRQKEAKWYRKGILRFMKKLCQTIAAHAHRHMQLLINHWSETTHSEKEAGVIIARMERILEQIPQALYQAREWIIGERKELDHEKILSLYESDIHVIVRGKASNETEFGNTLLIAEQVDGIIVDWKFLKGKHRRIHGVLHPV